MIRRMSLSILILLGVSSAALAQGGGRITGRVTSAEGGRPLPGVTVIVEGTNRGSISDTSGRYVLADVFTDAANLPMVEKFERIGFHKIGCPFQDTELDAPGSSIAMLLTLSQLLARVYTSPSPFFEYLLQFDPAFAFYRTNGEILLREGASIADVQTMTVAS